MITEAYRQYFSNGNRFPKGHPDYYRVIILNNILPIAIVIFTFFGLLNTFIFHVYAVAAMDFAVATYCLFLLYYFHKTDKVDFTAWGIVLILMMFLVLYLFQVENRYFGLYWTVIFPLVAYSLLGSRPGRWLSIGFYLYVLIFMLSQHTQWQAADFNLKALINLTLASAGILGGITYFEMGRQKAYHKLEQDNEILEETESILKMQNEEIQQQTEYVLSGVSYAKRIQKAILPNIRSLHCYFSDTFLIYKPKETVSGDFYWHKFDNHLLHIAVADCTGHGVPGALMSMLGVSFLNDIIDKPFERSPSVFLSRLKNRVDFTLKESENIQSGYDGMDISLITINTMSNELTFSGACSDLIIIRNKTIHHFKGDKIPIGFSKNINKEYADTGFWLQKGDVIYLFSDGYIDQLGEQTGRRFNSVSFSKLLQEISALPLARQKQLLETKYAEWKGSNEQIDDITILALQI